MAAIACLLLCTVADVARAAAPVLPPPAPPLVAEARLPRRINPTGREVVLTVPLRSTGPIGEVEIALAPDDSLTIRAEDFAAAVARLVRPEDAARIRAAADARGRVTPAALQALGYTVSYDADAAELVLAIAPALLATRTLDFGGGESGRGIEPDRSELFAAFLDYRLGAISQRKGGASRRAYVVGDFELAGRFGQALGFETYATLDGRSPRPLTRTASRLIYDVPGDGVRVTVGDLFTESTGFQTDPQLAGFNVSRLASGLGGLLARPGGGGRNLVLEREADVEVVVNGLTVGRVHLGPGSYDLRNLPVSQGANAFRVIVTDSSGQRRTIEFGFLQSAQLLAPGQSEFTVSLGAIAPLGTRGPDYTDRAALSGFWRRGITSQFTLGADFQVAGFAQLYGLAASIGTSFGLVGVNLAHSHTAGVGDGQAMRVQYAWSQRRMDGRAPLSLNLFAEYATARFQPLAAATPPSGNVLSGATGPRATRALLVSGDASVPLRRTLSLRLQGSYSHARGGLGDSGLASAQLVFQAPFRTTVGLGASYQWAPRNLPSPAFGGTTIGRGASFLASLTHRFGRTAVFTAGADRFTQRASVVRTPERPIDDWFLTADAARNRLGTSSNLVAGYETSRGDLELTSQASFDARGHLQSAQAGAFAIGAVAFAGGTLALGRRINDAFAILPRDATLHGHQLTVRDRSGRTVYARSGRFGAALVPLPAYTPVALAFDLADLPPGYDLGSGALDVWPWVHAGYRQKVGSAESRTAIGDLVDGDGRPVALRSGTVRRLDDARAPLRDLLTNGAGRFALGGVAPGRYRIEIPGEPVLTWTVTVSAASTSLVRLGSLRPDPPR